MNAVDVPIFYLLYSTFCRLSFCFYRQYAYVRAVTGFALKFHYTGNFCK